MLTCLNLYKSSKIKGNDSCDIQSGRTVYLILFFKRTKFIQITDELTE